MDWQQLLQRLQQRVGSGEVTTFGNCSRWALDRSGGRPSVAEMLDAAARRGNQKWTNRVVRDDGGIEIEPGRAYGQRSQLQAEGVRFDARGRVDLTQHPPVVL
jgi:alkylated DNA nucleotide flippase Atl1